MIKDDSSLTIWCYFIIEGQKKGKLGMKFSQVVLGAFLGTLGLLAGCGRDKKSSSSPTAPTEAQAVIDTLWVFADSSVSGEPKSGVTTRRRGESVSYRYGPASGFKNAVVVIDTAVVALSGSLVMNGNRRIIAAAEKIPVVPPEAKPVETSAAAVYTAPTPEAVLGAYLENVKEIEKLYAAYGAEAARELAYIASLAAYEAADEKSIEAAERALEGRLFGPGGEVKTSFAAPPAGGASLSAGRGTSLIFVPGILNSTDKAAVSRKEIELLVSEAGLGSEIEVYSFYNASALYEEDELRKCLTRAIQRASSLAMSLCKGVSALKDLAEARRQIAELFNRFPGGAEPAAKTLTRIIRQERGRGRCVILVGHSQGTLMIQQALKEIGGYDQCVTAISLGGPLGKESWSFWKESNYDGFVVAGERGRDIILALGYNDFTRVATNLSAAADQELARISPYATGILMAAEPLLIDVRLHNMATSYLAGKESRELLKSIIVRQAAQLKADSDCRVPQGARIYASSGQMSVLGSSGPSDLWIVPPFSYGVDTLVARIRTADGFSPAITDVARHPDEGLWAVSFNRLYKLDERTGLLELFGSFTSFGGVNALAFDPDGRPYVATNEGIVAGLTLDPPGIFWKGQFGSNLISHGDIAFAPDGRFFAAVGSKGNEQSFLAKVDIEKGGRAEVLSCEGKGTGVPNLWGLAFIGNSLFGLTTDSKTGKGALIALDTSTGCGAKTRDLSFNAFGAAAKPGR